MLSNIGNILIIIVIAISISIIYFSLISLKDKNNFISTKIITLSLYQTTFSITCFFSLIIGFVISDFSLTTVYQNSHSLKPLFYKISGTWGNHEGSLLLWINVLVIFSYLFLIYNKKSKKNYRLYTCLLYTSPSPRD